MNSELRQEVRERDNHECRFCEFDDNLHTHHVIPRKAGGSDSLENLITVCASCHKTIESTQGKALKRLKNELQNNLLQNLDSIVVDKVVHIARSVSIGADRLWYIGCDKEKAISEYKQAERPRLRTAKVTVEIEKEDIKDAVEESLPACFKD